MDLMLIGVTVLSLVLAVAMSAVAWRLLRDARTRSAARIEALEAMALGSDLGMTGAGSDLALTGHAPEPLRTLHHEAPRPNLSTQDLTPRSDVTPSTDDWDLSLHDSGPDTDIDFEYDDVRERRNPSAPSPARAGRGVRMVHEDMFDSTHHVGAGGHRWLALAAVGLVMAAGVVVLSALHSPEIVAAVTASRSGPTTDGSHPLELLSLKHSGGNDGTFTVTGLVQNPPDGVPVGKIIAVVYLFDGDGKFFASGRATIDLPAFQPGDESPFIVRIPNVAGVTRYRVGFRREDGLVVAHVDRRGQLPEGTTGDQIDGGNTRYATPASATRRPEGD
jgi:hypothetical protein